MSRKTLGKIECNLVNRKCKRARLWNGAKTPRLAVLLLSLSHQRDSPSKTPLWGWGTHITGQHHPPSLAGLTNPRSLQAGVGPGNWLLEGLLILSGTACLPPRGLLKSLEDSWKPRAGVCCASKHRDRARTRDGHGTFGKEQGRVPLPSCSTAPPLPRKIADSVPTAFEQT